MSDQLASWLWDIAQVLSPIAAILLLIRHILRALLRSIVILHKIGRVLRPTVSQCRHCRRRVSKAKR
jgi:hypothetical protein